MHARSKHAPLDFRSTWTSSASIAADGSCPPHSCRNAELDHASCDRILNRWEMLAQDNAAPIARGLPTEQQVSAPELAPSVAQAGCVVTFDRRHRW
jgi:hypothetical protein